MSRLVVSGGPRWGTAPQRVWKEGIGSGCRLMALEGHSGAPHPLAGKKTWCQGHWPSLDRQTDPLFPQRPFLPALVLTSQPHINERVINEHQFVEVEFVGEPFPLSFVQNAFVIIIAVDAETPSG